MTPWRVLVAIAIASSIAAFIVACGDGDDDDSISGVVWEWVEFDGQIGDNISVPNPEQFTIEFTDDEGSFNLRADCNTGSGKATIDGDNITFGAFAITQAYCGDESLDREYIRLLGEIESFERDGDNLTFTLLDGAGEMKFEAQSS